MEASVKLQILGWDDHFENYKSRERDQCNFVCVPNKQGGMGLAQVLSQADGAAIYGIWHLMLGAASTQKRPRKGYLSDNGTSTGRFWSLDEMATRWRRTLAEMTRAVEILTSSNVGWIRDLDESAPAEYPPSTPAVPAAHPPSISSRAREEGNRREGNRIEGKGTLPPAKPSEVPPKEKPKREADPIWEVVAEIWFEGSVAQPDASRVGKIVRDLKRHDATPAEIHSRYENHLHLWPRAEASPESLVKNWVRMREVGKSHGAQASDDEPHLKVNYDLTESQIARLMELEAERQKALDAST